MSEFDRKERPSHGSKCDWWKCARCGCWFGVNETMHGCYSGAALNPPLRGFFTAAQEVTPAPQEPK
jgi:hypothetical protein